MKERESVFVKMVGGEWRNHPDAEVTRGEDWLTVDIEDGVVFRFNLDHIAYYCVGPVEVKNLDN